MVARTHKRVGPRPPQDVAELFRRVLSPDEACAMDVLFEVRAACQRMDGTVQAWLGPDAISPSRMHVLMVLWAAGRPVPQMHVVRALKVSRTTVSKLIEGLLQSGHVTSTVGPDDRRNALVGLTPEGEELARRTTGDNAARMLAALADLSHDDQARLVELLAKARTSFEAHGPAAGDPPRA